MAIRRKVVIKGEIQGSDYVSHAQTMALNLGICGWARTSPNGDVEACFEGEEGPVHAMLAWCFLGPERSRVYEVIIRNTPYRGRFKDMSIRVNNVY